MSEESHPDFHAVEFAIGVNALYNKCLRGLATYEHTNLDRLSILILETVAKFEDIADESCDRRQAAESHEAAEARKAWKEGGAIPPFGDEDE